jgi:hypothetical protein
LASWLPADSSAQDVEGGVAGMLQGGTTYSPGVVGSAFQFDGASAVVTVPHSPRLSFGTTSPMTVDAWLYRTGSASLMHIIGKRVDCTPNVNYQLVLTPGPDYLVFGGQSNGVASGVDLPMNTWTHVAGSFDGSTFRIYVNGALAGTSAAGQFLGPPNNAPLTIGSAGACVSFAGSIDETHIFSRALSDSEIAAIYQAGSAGLCRGCLASRTEDFSGSTLEPFYEVFAPCGPPVLNGSELVLHRPSGCTGAVGIRFHPYYELCGDFDVSVDYRLTSWTPPTGVSDQFTGLLISKASDPGLGSGLLAGIERFSAPSIDGCKPYRESYKFYGSNSASCASSWASTNDSEGRLRMVRQDSTLAQFYASGPYWILGRVSPITREPVIVNLYAGSNPQESQYDYEARMDQLLIITGSSLAVEPVRHEPQFSLSASPNPLRATARIRFEMPIAGMVRLGVFDLAGRRLAVLKSGLCSAGRHEMSWDGRDDSGSRLPPQVVFVRGESMGQSKSVKVLLLQ